MNKEPQPTQIQSTSHLKTVAIVASVVLGLFAVIGVEVVGSVASGPKVPEPADYATACEYTLSNRPGYEEAGITWIKKNTDYPVNAYIGLMGVRASGEDGVLWSQQPEYQALVALGESAVPAIKKKLKELEKLEMNRRMASARMAGLMNDAGYSRNGGSAIWRWQGALNDALEEIGEN